MERRIEDFVRGLGIDAYLVGGAVRDEILGRPSKDADFLVPGVDYEGLRALLAPHGRVEDLEVAGRRVGARLYPRDAELRRLAPAGIEFAPPRIERSTGPGRHDFEIVADPAISVEDDMRRRDFTVNAIARRLGDDGYVDPLGGEDDLRRGILRTVSARSFAEDPLRLVRGLRLVSQLGLDPDPETLEQMRGNAGAIRLVSGERVGGGLAADGRGELSKLLLGDHPAKALRLARDTGVLTALLPEFEPAIGFDQESRWHGLPLDEHLFAVAQAAADAGYPLEVRLAGLLHDLGKPGAAWRGPDGRVHYYARPGYSDRGHEEIGAELAGRIMRRLRYPNSLRRRARDIVRHHMVDVGRGDAVRARRFLARHGDELALDLLSHRDADLRGKYPPGHAPPQEDLERLTVFRRVVERERSSPHRLRDLAVDGSDLIEAGFTPGPELGRALDTLLGDVVGNPDLNTRDRLLHRARQLLAGRR
jgi:tRNA nucleotidyltransferase/poly(A) polymerase